VTWQKTALEKGGKGNGKGKKPEGLGKKKGKLGLGIGFKGPKINNMYKRKRRSPKNKRMCVQKTSCSLREQMKEKLATVSQKVENQ